MVRLLCLMLTELYFRLNSTDHPAAEPVPHDCAFSQVMHGSRLKLHGHREHSGDEILRLYRSLEWTTRTPPPLTVYLLPYLQDLLSRRSQTAPKSLPTEEDHGRSSRRSSQAAPSDPKHGTTESRAPRTPPGAVSSSALTATGILPSRPRAPKHTRASSRPAAPRRRPRSSSSRRSRTPPKDPQRRRPKPRSTVSSDSTAAVANSPGPLIDAFFKTTDAAAPRVYRARCAFDIPCPPLSHAIRLVRHTHPALRFSSVQIPEQCIAPGLNPASAVPHLTSALQVDPILALPRAPARSSLRRGPQFATPCQLTAQRNAMGRRPLCDRHAIRVAHSPSFCFDRCSHCQSLTRFCVSRLGLCSGPLFRSCHPRTTQSQLPLAIIQRKPPPSSIRTRSWQPLIQQPTAMLQGMAERSARAARGEVFGPPIPVPWHGPQPGTPQASGARSSPPPIRRRSRSPRTTHQSDRLPAPALEDTTSAAMDANYFVEIQVDPSRPIHVCLQIRILPAEAS